MNAKKAKAIRKRIRAIEAEGHTFAPRGLVEVPHTRRIRGYTLPDGWTWERYARLCLTPGAWLDEAKTLIKPITTATLINAFGSARAFYQQAKQRLA